MSYPLNKTTKTRFCPSPTGLVHLGNLRTALFCYLLAKSVGGNFLLRIEDTDFERSEARYSEQLQLDLLWLGLEWQEGPGHEQGRGPYFQSQRNSIYTDYYQRLLTTRAAYPCFCTEEELALVRKIQRSSGKPPRYPGTCQFLTQEEIDAKINAGRKPTLRFHIPAGQEVVFTDLVRGEQRFQTDDLGDFIIRRQDGTAPFLFCNAIDDALMEVTHVLRGEDHVANTPRQILILEALGLPIPDYGHISMILGPDGSPLSKRHGSRSLVALRNEGYLPLAIANYLGRLGHFYGHDHTLSLAGLASEFKAECLNTSPAKYNEDQLDHWQKKIVDQLTEDEAWQWLGEEIQQLVPLSQRQLFLAAVKPNITFPADAKKWATVFFTNFELKEMISTHPDYFKEALNAFDQFGAEASKILDHLKFKLNLKGQPLFLPLRMALTGASHGPELAKIMNLLQPSEIKSRLIRAKQLVENL